MSVIEVDANLSRAIEFLLNVLHFDNTRFRLTHNLTVSLDAVTQFRLSNVSRATNNRIKVYH
jgi:hypothetical protein